MESKASSFVTISVHEETKGRLAKRFRPRESWDDLLSRMMDDLDGYSKTKKIEVPAR